jgi:hypothetical protein
MSRRIWICIALLAASASALAAGSVPAFGDDKGTIAATVRASAGVCIQLSTTSLNFGSHPFAENGQLSFALSDPPTFTVTNCPTAPESTFSISGTNANGPGGASWTLTDAWQQCDGTLNRYGIGWAQNDPFNPGGFLTTTPRTVVHRRAPSESPVSTFQPGESAQLLPQVNMPCALSAGAGQAFSFSILLTAMAA